MKTYIKPEIEEIEFVAEAIADEIIGEKSSIVDPNAPPF